MSVLVEKRDSYVLLCPCDGIFVRDSVRDMLTHVRKFQHEGHVRFLMDFSTCGYISSEGLGMISELWKFCGDRAKGKLVVLLSPDPANEVPNLLETVGLLQVLRDNLFTSRKAAEAAFIDT